jgi:uncharacterized membrane protein YdjX (TVP38/TMEM64 family)
MDISELIVQTEAWFRESHPLWLIAGMALLPLVPFPISPLWILAGIRFGFLGGLAACFAAMVVNLFLAYGLALILGRPLINRLVSFTGYTLPKIPRTDETKWIFLFRITPGIPLVVQNYTLGVARVNFWRYLLISIIVQISYAAAFLLFGSALFSGTTGWAISGVLLAISLFIVFRLIQKRLAARAVSPAPANCDLHP